MGAACSAYFFLVSTGPVQDCIGYGIWLSEAPPESRESVLRPRALWAISGRLRRAPYINWYEIPVTTGFLVLAAARWWILTAPKRPAARPVESL
jgi:hypothetical protein